MEKLRVTKKQIKEGYKNIIEIGYCELQTLLRYESARYYTCGVYGWNADIYELDHDTVIVTGYNPFGNIKISREIIKKYEDEAGKIAFDWSKSYEENKKAIDKLIQEFTKEVLGGVENVG